MVRIKNYEDGERLIISFDGLSKSDKDKIDKFINDLGNSMPEKTKVPDIKPLALYPLSKDNDQQNITNDTNNTIITSNISNISDTDKVVQIQKDFFPEIMTVYDIKAALTNLTGHAKMILEKKYKAKGFYNLNLYLDLTSEAELREVFKKCI